MEGLGARESLNDGYSAVLDILSHILFMALPLCSMLEKKRSWVWRPICIVLYAVQVTYNYEVQVGLPF